MHELNDIRPSRQRTRLATSMAVATAAAFTIAIGPALLAHPIAAQEATQAASPDGATVVFLVRHSERAEDGTSDPVISLPGWDRSRLLAEMLEDAGVTNIYTTDYRRTRGTGKPLADALGLELQVYDPRDLNGFAEELWRTPGRHVVIGHSNTTPELVEALGGDPISPMADDEYDRLYVVALTSLGATSMLIRFGARYGG
jgi:phosphohistidine phosphatase SixA